MKKRTKKPRVTFINPYGLITAERIEALPEPVKNRLGLVTYAILMGIGERNAQSAVKVAA